MLQTVTERNGIFLRNKGQHFSMSTYNKGHADIGPSHQDRDIWQCNDSHLSMMQNHSSWKPNFSPPKSLKEAMKQNLLPRVFAQIPLHRNFVCSIICASKRLIKALLPVSIGVSVCPYKSSCIGGLESVEVLSGLMPTSSATCILCRDMSSATSWSREIAYVHSPRELLWDFASSTKHVITGT